VPACADVDLVVRCGAALDVFDGSDLVGLKDEAAGAGEMRRRIAGAIDGVGGLRVEEIDEVVNRIRSFYRPMQILKSNGSKRALHIPAGPLKLLQHTSWLTPNQSELATLTGLPTRNKSEVATAGRKLRMCGVENILATCGARGVCWCGAAGARWFAAPKIPAIDTVGAGDCFSGAFAAAVAEGNSVEDAIRFAIAAAAISVTRPGAQSSMPTRSEILRALPNQ